MSPIANIRKNILGLSQTALGAIAGAEQATVSRWENGELEPNREQLARIRDAAIKSGVEWNDRWFFEAPESVE